MIKLYVPASRIFRAAYCRKDLLPAPLPARVGILAFQSIRQIDTAIAVGRVMLQSNDISDLIEEFLGVLLHLNHPSGFALDTSYW